MNRIFKQLATTSRALPLLLCTFSMPLYAADKGDDTLAFSALDYHAQPTLFSGMSARTRVLVDNTMQNFRVFNQHLASSLERTEFRMNAMDLPAPENWDYEYWDYVKEPKSFVMPTEDGGVMFEFQFKY